MIKVRVCFGPVLLSCCLLLAWATGPAFAAAAKKPAPAPPPDMRKLIQLVDAANSQVVIVQMVNTETHTYRIDDMTVLKVNGVPGKFADIKKGMVVTDYVERDNDDLDSLTLTGSGGEPTTAAKTKPKPKPKPVATAPDSTSDGSPSP